MQLRRDGEFGLQQRVGAFTYCAQGQLFTSAPSLRKDGPWRTSHDGGTLTSVTG